jgi:hypothetical protein
VVLPLGQQPVGPLTDLCSRPSVMLSMEQEATTITVDRNIRTLPKDERPQLCTDTVGGKTWTSKAPYWFPEFFAVGPARTASTWLHNVLAPHANLPVTIKETRFLDKVYGRGLPWYRDQFSPAQEKLPFGEIAPTYFHSSLARTRIKKHAHDARIICTLRDPVERLYSLFRLLRFRASNNWTFEYALTHDEEMIESARYSHYLRAWIQDFGRSNVLVSIYDDIKRDAQAYIDRICDFVRIPQFSLPPSQQSRVNGSEDLRAPTNYTLVRMYRYLSAAASALRFKTAFRLANRIGLRPFVFGKGRELPPLDPSVAAELRKRLAPEVEEVEQIIGRDLSGWKA